jgi:hypothetical protein
MKDAGAMPRIEKLNSFELEPISAATRQLLCAFATADPRRPLGPVDADWEEVFQGVCRHGLVGVTYFHLKQQESRQCPPESFRAWVRQAYVVDSLRMAVLYRNIRWVLIRLREDGVDHLVVKGPAVAHAVYRDATLRSFGDLDLVVRERDWSRARRVLLDLGLVPAEDLPQPPPKLAGPLVLHGTHFWEPKTQFLVEVHYDDLLESGLASRDVEGFWRRAAVTEVQGVPVKTLSLEDQLVHLSAHVHYHGYTRLNWLTDLACIVRDRARLLDWDRMVETVRTEEAQVPVYYTLHYLERLLGVSAPADVLDALRPDRVRRWLHERYLPEAQVLSLQPMARPAFSFHFQPLFLRLLPDLLVMGRRKEKLRCLLRLLLPPSAWLRHYYRLGEGDRLLAHYLLHPAKLAFHYLSEMVIALDRLRRRGRDLAADDPWWAFFPPPLSSRDPRGVLGTLRALLPLAKAALRPPSRELLQAANR